MRDVFQQTGRNSKVSFYCWGKSTLLARKQTSVPVVVKPRLPKDFDNYIIRDVEVNQDSLPGADIKADFRVDTRALSVTINKDKILAAGAYLCTATALEVAPASKKVQLLHLDATPDLEISAGGWWQAKCKLPSKPTPIKGELARVLKFRSDDTVRVLAPKNMTFPMPTSSVSVMVEALKTLPRGLKVSLGYAIVTVKKDVRKETLQAAREKSYERQKLAKDTDRQQGNRHGGKSRSRNGMRGRQAESSKPSDSSRRSRGAKWNKNNPEKKPRGSKNEAL